MNFGPKYVFQIPEAVPFFGGVWVTNTVTTTWIIMVALFILAFVLTRKLNEVPEGKQNFAEMLIDGLNGLVAQTMGGDKMGFAPYVLTLMLYLAIANLSGLLGFRPPTADLNTTLALSLLTFFMTQGFGFKSKKLGYLKGFVEPFPLMLPMNIIGELANPVSLSFRLFGNILGGVVIMALLYQVIPLGVPAVLHVYFDVFSGLIQTFIFAMLSMVFISMAMD